MAGRKIRNERDARRCLAAAAAAGLSRGQWARQHGVDGRSLFAWSKNLERAERARSKKSGRRQRGLVERVAGSVMGNRYVVRCGELSVEVGDEFDETTLGRLLRVMAQC
jgi:hypothetical protein